MPDASGYVERTETLALRKELGSGSDVTGVQDVGTGLWYGMTDIEADGVGSETLALRKELGSGSDVTGVQDVGTGLWLRCLIRSMGEIGLQLDSDPSMMYGMTDIEADGVGSETLALRKELGSGSDVTGSARCWNRVMVTSMLMLSVQVKGPWLVVGFSVRYGMTDIEADGVGSETLALRKELGSGSDVTWSARCWNRVMVTSMLMLSVQVKGPWLVVGFSVRYGMTDIEADGVGSETLALRKELGSGSDVTGVQDVGTGLWVRLRCLIRSMGEIGLQLDLGSVYDREREREIEAGSFEREKERERVKLATWEDWREREREMLGSIEREREIEERERDMPDLDRERDREREREKERERCCLERKTLVSDF
ncbi:A-Kinase Anchor Protein 13 [Manis pentadactyla]|nr:A-Kinase Anchor Protein 13 [Manis pentadactyla]